MDASGNLYISDSNNHSIRKVGTNGVISTIAGAFYFNDPFGLAVDAGGNVLVADIYANKVFRVNTNGVVTTVAGNGSMGFSGDGGQATNASLHYPYGVAIDAVGNVLIADTDSSRVRKVDSNGVITTVAGNGAWSYTGDGGPATTASFNLPYGITLDSSGDVFVVDMYNNRIRLISTNGLITTVAGSGTAAYSGDGGSATNAALNSPSGVAVDALGNVFIADANNNRVRKVSGGQGPTLVLSYVSHANAGAYDVVVTGPYGSVTSQVATLTVLDPAIAVQPASQAASSGTTATFNVTAAGTQPLAYQWMKGGTNLMDGGNIFGSQTTSLMVSNVFGADAGGYSVIISNAFGSITSAVATLTVIDPVITVQPVSQTLNLGDSVRLSVGAAGTPPLSYQWRKDGLVLAAGMQSSLVLTNLQGSDAGTYVVVVSNVWGSVTSTPALLGVNLASPDSFNPGANSSVYSLALQRDGKILVGGGFTTLGGQNCNYIGRLNSDGTLDTGFSPGQAPTCIAFCCRRTGRFWWGAILTRWGGNLATTSAD